MKSKKDWLSKRVRFETEQDRILERRVINYLLTGTDLQAVKLGDNKIDFAIVPKGKQYDPSLEGEDLIDEDVIAYVEVKGSCMNQSFEWSKETHLKHFDSIWLSVKKLSTIQYCELVIGKPTFVVYPYGSGHVLFIRYFDIQGLCKYRGMKPREGSTHDEEMIISISKRRFSVYDPEPPNFLQDLYRSQ